MKRKTVLLLGSGALKIGEAGEFDYSGSQAIKALREAGYRIALVNPNVATVQTSEGMADAVYFLPVTPYFVEKVIAKERPTGILLSFGGQTALNCGLSLARSGVLKKYRVSVMGTPINAVAITEDRKRFADHLRRLGVKTARGNIVHTQAEANIIVRDLGFPVMMRTGFALGGAGSGVAQNQKELDVLLSRAFATSAQVIVEESLWGWKEIEYEVVRDRFNNCITVCNMENMDPVGIHTGESIVVAPSQTLNSDEYYRFRQMSIDVIRSLGIIGECNIQYAVNPTTGDYRIIEVNARLSRSSALASKATGYPLAYIAAKLAVGETLPGLRNSMTGKTSAFFEPALDYCVVKIPRWDLDKFARVESAIGSEMKSVGEVMAVGRTFEEAVQKAARMLGQGYEGVFDNEADPHAYAQPTTKRLFSIAAAIRSGVPVDTIAKKTGIDRWFLRKLEHIVQIGKKLARNPLTRTLLTQSKQAGFSDKQIGEFTHKTAESIRARRKRNAIVPAVKRIDTMAGEFPVATNYLYLTYNGAQSDYRPEKGKKAVVLGCGPYAIGTSVEFDWCAVFTARRLRERHYKAILVNSNPETVSTDYDESDFLYFEELSHERILDITDIEKAPIIVSMGGQIPNNLAPRLAAAGVRILGTQSKDIYRAEHRRVFSRLLNGLGVAQPAWGKVESAGDAVKQAKAIGYPVLVRPSFVLSGRAMQVIGDEKTLRSYIAGLPFSFSEYPLVMSRFLADATECDFDGVAQHGKIVAWAVSEHVEAGGVHSGDSSLMLPAAGIPALVQQELFEESEKIAAALNINGPFNIQYLISQGVPFVIECNARASRSFPFVSKALGINFITLAADVLLGKKVRPHKPGQLPYTVVKVPQFSFKKLRGADPLLHVEMASTGEVSAFGPDVWTSYLTAVLAAGTAYPEKKAVFLSLGEMKGKLSFLKGAHLLHRLGYTVYATEGTAFFLKENGIAANRVGKIYAHGDITVLDLMREQRIDFAVVTTDTSRSTVDKKVAVMLSDGYVMRRTAIDLGIPIFTNSEAATFFVEGLRRNTPGTIPIRSWQEYARMGVRS